MIKSILFDYNGIFGPDSDDWNSYREFANKTGLPDDKLSAIFDSYWQTISIGQRNLIDFLKEVASKSPNKITAKELLLEYLNNITVYKDALDLAKSLKEKGLKLIILSNETKEAMDYKIKKFNLREIFDELYASANIGMTKRNPEAFKFVLEKEALNPYEILFIDDREHNVEMAKTFGMKGIWFRNLNQLKEELKKY